MDLVEIAKQAREAVREVGDYVVGAQSHIHSIKLKGVKDFQTDVDVKAEEMLRNKLRTILPDAGFVVEEGENTSQEVEYSWVIDPIDGTKFFSTQYPVYFTQIALSKGLETLIAVIYTPSHKQLFYAIKGHGSYLNDRRIEIQYDGLLAQSMVNFELGRIDEGSPQQKILNILAPKVARVIVISGLFAPYLVTNTIQAYVRFNYRGIEKIYDLAPRWLIHEEAGAKRNTYTYLGQKLYISAHPKLVTEIEGVLGINS